MKTFQLYIAIPQEDKFALDFFDGDRLIPLSRIHEYRRGERDVVVFCEGSLWDDARVEQSKKNLDLFVCGKYFSVKKVINDLNFGRN